MNPIVKALYLNELVEYGGYEVSGGLVFRVIYWIGIVNKDNRDDGIVDELIERLNDE